MTDEQAERLTRALEKFCAAMERITVPNYLTLPPVPAPAQIQGCACPPGTVCGNMLCPRRSVFSVPFAVGHVSAAQTTTIVTAP